MGMSLHLMNSTNMALNWELKLLAVEVRLLRRSLNSFTILSIFI